MLTKGISDRQRFKLVVVRRRRAMRINVIDLLGLNAGVFHRFLHNAPRAGTRLVRHRQVKRVGRHTIAHEHRVYFCAAALRMFELLKDHDPGAFADDKAIAVGVKRPRRMMGIVVAR